MNVFEFAVYNYLSAISISTTGSKLIANALELRFIDDSDIRHVVKSVNNA